MGQNKKTLSKLAIIMIILSLVTCLSLATVASFNRDKIAQIYDYAIRYHPPITEVANAYVNVPYCASNNPKQQLNLYIPKQSPNANYPLVIQIHGGGWRWGDKENQISERYTPQLASRGIAVATVSYRLADEVTYPAQNQDIECAMQYLIRNAGLLSIDPSSIILMGDSAGGQLAAMQALTSPAKDAIKGVVMLYGVTDIWQQITSFNDTNAVYYLGSADKELAQLASPINTNLENAPPFLIIHGTADTVVPASASEAFVNKLRAAGAAATYIPVKGAGHAFIGGLDFREAYVHDTILDFITAKALDN